jgi:hypothetical protein
MIAVNVAGDVMIANDAFAAHRKSSRGIFGKRCGSDGTRTRRIHR